MAQHAESTGRKIPLVVVALPFSYREGMDEYSGVMRYLRETGTAWDLRIVRHSFGADVFAGFPIDEVSGVICGMNFRQGIVSYEPSFPGDALELLVRNDIPVVGLDIPQVPAQCRRRHARCAFVSVDSALIGRRAAQYFARSDDYESFGFVGAFSDRAWSRDRGAFFARELRSIGRRRVRIFKGDSRNRADGLAEWIKGLAKPAAVFAANDHCAAVVLKACDGAKIRVPHDVAVLGVDDDPVFCVHTQPTLSSLHPDFESEGYEAAHALSELLARRSPERRTVVGGTVTVTERMSTAPSSSAGRLVRRVDEIIEERACSGLSADVIAGMLGISRRLLDMRYRQISGRSVRGAIESVRLGHAKRLLSETHLSHREIARSCAFGSDSYLEKVFMKRFGLTMGAFRRLGEHLEGT